MKLGIKEKLSNIKIEIDYKLKEIDNLYHSNDSNLSKNNLCGLGVFFLVLSILFFIFNFLVGKKTHEDMAFVIQISTIYMGIVFLLLSILSFITYPYIHGKTKRKKQSKREKKCYRAYLYICLIAFIPAFIYISIIWLLINKSTSKVGNLGIWAILIVVDTAIIFCSINITASIVDNITYNIVEFYKIRHGIEIDSYTITLFLSIAFIKIIMDIINRIALFILEKIGIKRIENRIRSDSRNKRPDATIEYKTEDLKRDLAFQKKTFWKFQLAILIFLFVIATFAPYSLFENHQGDAVNVITLFTLIMLFKDKIREWR